MIYNRGCRKIIKLDGGAVPSLCLWKNQERILLFVDILLIFGVL